MVYLLAPSGNNYSSAPTDTNSIVSYDFTANAGTYKVYARVRVPSQEDDSFWVRVNGGTWLRWNLIPGNSAFSWHQIHDRENNTAFLTFDLPSGTNTIDIGHREDGAGIDKLYVTKTTKLPSGFGDNTSNCGSSGKQSDSIVENETLEVISETGFSTIVPVLYPNPAGSFTTIRMASINDVSKVYLFDLTGRVVRSYIGKSLNKTPEGVELNLIGVENGIYMINVISTNEESYRLKLIVKN